MMFISDRDYKRILNRLEALELKERCRIDKQQDIYAARDLQILRQALTDLSEQLRALTLYMRVNLVEIETPPLRYKVEPSE